MIQACSKNTILAVEYEASMLSGIPKAPMLVIDPDVAEYFPGHDAVNEALRGLTAIIKRRQKAEPAAARGRATARQ